MVLENESKGYRKEISAGSIGGYRSVKLREIWYEGGRIIRKVALDERYGRSGIL
jgi:hypothetical protein